MKKRLLTIAGVLTLAGSLLSPLSQAASELDTVNLVVAQKAQMLDDSYGVLLSHAELNDLKVSLVTKQLAEQIATQEQASGEKLNPAQVELLVNHAVVTYEITDSVDVRKMMIGLEAESGVDDHSGSEPPSTP